MAESKFDRLARHIAREYRERGYSEEEAQRIGHETAAKVGREKYGEKRMEQKAESAREAT